MSKTIYTQRLSWVQDIDDECFEIEPWQAVVDDHTRHRAKVIKVDRISSSRARIHIKASKAGLIDCIMGFDSDCWIRLNGKKLKAGTVLKKFMPHDIVVRMWPIEVK